MLRYNIAPAILVVLSATALVTAQATLNEAVASECNARPGLSGPRGTHWYYRVDRATNRRCWYLGSRGIEVRSHPQGAMSYVERQLGRPSTRALAKQLAQHDRKISAQTTSAQMATVELPELSVSERAMTIDFRARWLTLAGSKDLDMREVATVNYTDNHPAKDARQTLFPEPVIEAKRAGLQPLGSAFQAAVLAMVVLLFAGAAFKLAGWPLQSHSRDRWLAGADRPASPGPPPTV